MQLQWHQSHLTRHKLQVMHSNNAATFQKVLVLTFAVGVAALAWFARYDMRKQEAVLAIQVTLVLSALMFPLIVSSQPAALAVTVH